MLEAEGASPRDAPVISRVWRRSEDVRRKLWRLLDQPHILRVFLEDRTYFSELVAIRPSENVLVLDMLVPKDGNRLVEEKPGVRCEARTFHLGFEWTYRFNTRLEGLFSYGGMLSVRASFPDRVEEKAYLYWAAFDFCRPLYLSFEVEEKIYELPVKEMSMYGIKLEGNLQGKGTMSFSIIFPDGSREDFLGSVKEEGPGMYMVCYEDASPVVQRKIADYLQDVYSAPRRPATWGQPKRILVVDDEPEVVEVLERMLHRLNYRTMSAHGGEEAIRKAIEDPPDLILLDLLMPGMSGEEVCMKLKEHPRTKHIPILVLTAVRDMSRLGDLNDIGAAGYIQKPFVFEELSERLKSALEGEPPQVESRASKVLLISKDADLVGYVAGNLDPSKYNLLYLTDGTQVVWRALREEVGVVVVDADGISISPEVVCRALRRNQRTASIPLVILTEDGNLEVEHEPAYLVPKPFDMGTLEEVLARALGAEKLG